LSQRLTHHLAQIIEVTSRLSLLYGGRATIRHERSAETVKAIVTIPIVPNFPSNT
jgi:hypothetical protein